MRLSIYLLGAAGVLGFAAAEVQARGFGAARAGGVAVGPYGARAGGASASARVGPRGGSVQHVQGGGVSRGPLGGVHAGGGQATRVTTPGGRSYTTGSRAGASVGPAGGVHAHASRSAAVSGPHGGAAVRQGGAVAAGPFGASAASYRGGVAVGRGGVAVGHSTRYVSTGAMRHRAGYVRTGYGARGYSYFTPAWYGVHTTAWTTTRWRTPNVWVAPAWTSVSTWCGVAAPPVFYDYGSSVVIENNNVYVNGESAGSADQYAQQAATLSDKGRAARPSDEDEWQPLGVFGLIQGEGEKTAQNIFQLAVNKSNVVRGNYYDALADTTLTVFGSVDPKTQKVAWSIGDKKTVVYEAGLNNLTKDETTVLVHYGKERTQQMVLVRLEQGKDATR